MSKRKPKTPVDVENYSHSTSSRKNIPPAKIAGEGKIPKVEKVKYGYSAHLSPELQFDTSGKSDRVAQIVDKAIAGQKLTSEEAEILRSVAGNVSQPWLEWSGKKEEHDRRWLEVDPVALYIHERVSAKAIVRTAKKKDVERSLFANPEQEYAEAVQFYQHDVDWANRLILGDSLQVMSSLARSEDLAGKVQMIYMDPPYGINFRSNFQTIVGELEVTDREADLTREPEAIRAYRDTWCLGVHSYLTYLRDRFRVARELLADTGSIFVQIGDMHLQRVRQLLDDVFGLNNAVVVITVKKKSSTSAIESIADYLLWYTKDKASARIRRLCVDKGKPEDADKFRRVELPTGERRMASLLSEAERTRFADRYVRDDYPVVSQDPSKTRSVPVVVEGVTVTPGINKHWRHDPTESMRRLELAGRLRAGRTTAYGIQYWGDTGSFALGNVWTDTHGEASPVYPVQTNRRIVERCMHMVTVPGDLVLDPTCGGATTAYVAETIGRRWIMIDASRVSITVARQRMLTAQFEYFALCDENKGIAGGIRCATKPLIEIGAIARNENLDPILEKHQPLLDELLGKCNDALADVSDALRGRLVKKLREKQEKVGKRCITDADERRWNLPNRLEHWLVPFDTDGDWPESLQSAIVQYRKAWRAKMDAVNECIAANSEQETLVDQPEVINGVVRVSGPFSVEGVRPEELSLDENGNIFDPTPNEWESSGPSQNASAYVDRMIGLLDADGVTFPNNEHRNFLRVDALDEVVSAIHAEAVWEGGNEDEPCNVAIAFGPQYGPVTAGHVEDLIRASRRYDELVVAGFSFDGAAQEVIQESANLRLKIHMAHIRPDVSPGMDGLLKDTPQSQLFTVFGQPEIEVQPAKKGEDGEVEVELLGVDIYSPLTGEIKSTGASKVAAWFLDSDYDGRCFCITQAFFPDQNAWEKIAKALGSAADMEVFAVYNGTVSLPLKPGEHNRIAVKVIDPRGNEVMAIRNLGGGA